MTICLYGIPNCDTVKKARAWLDTHSLAYTFHDYKKQGADRVKLAASTARNADEPCNCARQLRKAASSTAGGSCAKALPSSKVVDASASALRRMAAKGLFIQK